MLGFLKKKARETKFDRTVLRKNNISLLILDERWNSIFGSIEKTEEIKKCEERLKELLKEQARLTSEAKQLPLSKKAHMDKILKLTTEAYENNNDEAKKDMQQCEKEIKRINQRISEVQDELETIPDRIKETNLELLEYMVNVVYFKMRANQMRVNELEGLIDQTKEQLKAFIDEKETLSKDYSDTYSYFHDLLGGEELEKLDREYLMRG